MLFEERQIVLKDGTAALLRPARVEDAAALIDYLMTTAGETEFILAYPDERAGMTVEQEERFLRGVMESDCSAFIVCEVYGETLELLQRAPSGERPTSMPVDDEASADDLER